jgi:adhesin transport system outer membrane protein
MRLFNIHIKILLLLALSFFYLSNTSASPLNEDLDQDNEALSGLSAALHATLQHNPELIIKLNEVDAQQYEIDSSKAARFPSLSAQANSMNADYAQAKLIVKQPLWAFGKIDSSINLAKGNLDLKKIELLQAQRQKIEETSVAYVAVEGINKRLKVAEQNVDEHQQLYEGINRRQIGKLASKTDERLAQSRLIQARAQYLQVQGELKIALSELQSLTQIIVSTDTPVDEKVKTLPSLTDIEALALKNDAAVAYSQSLVLVAQLEMKSKQVSSLPTVYVQVEHEFLDVRTNEDRTNTGFVIEGNFEGLGFVTYGQIKSSMKQLDAANSGLEAAKNNTRRHINSLMLNFGVQENLLESQREVVEVVESTMASFLRQYESGRKTWIEVLNIQRELAGLRFQLAQISTERLILAMRISSLIGQLDQLAGITK